ncbi:MAG TPA: TIGR03088 family PEP-CTERM/XrtA system glycosyltransferase [Rhodanobacteraceae bacterium]|nr:TIGR03088 family PEP-CTERM/XrtA system glycosyltransferase [Rhodanobacteraceae bacterium]
MNRKPLIAHVLYRLDTGGMERFVVTLINHTGDRYRHALICLTGFGVMRREIEGDDVTCLSLDKKPGKDWMCYFRLWRALRSLKPDLVHTYNVGTLDVAPVARLAGVRHVIHAERGRDVSDPHGENRRYRRLRRWLTPFIDRYVAVSRDLQAWLLNGVGIDPSKVACIPNGIDAAKFVASPVLKNTRPLLGDFAPSGTLLIGTISRLDAVKDQAGLIASFKLLCDSSPDADARLRLVIVGEGPERRRLEQQIAGLNLGGRVRLLGKREDVAALLAEWDLFVLSSVAEGMPNAVLEAMASGLPVVATNVGGIPEVVADGVTGTLVPARDPTALAEALRRYTDDAVLRSRHGLAGRQRMQEQFSLSAMLSDYNILYDELLAGGSQKQPTAGLPVGLAERREP